MESRKRRKRQLVRTTKEGVVNVPMVSSSTSSPTSSIVPVTPSVLPSNTILVMVS